MVLLYWENSLSVGNEEIDRQHKRMFDIIHNLLEYIKSPRNKEELGKILSELEAYVNYHFDTEELYFEKINFPLKDTHIKEHEEFRRQIKEWIEQFHGGKQVLLSRLLKDLLIWVKNHIGQTDKLYAPYLKEIKSEI